MEKIGHFLEDEVAKLYQEAKEEGFNKKDASPYIEENLRLKKSIKKICKKLGWWLCHGRFSWSWRCFCFKRSQWN